MKSIVNLVRSIGVLIGISPPFHLFALDTFPIISLEEYSKKVGEIDPVTQSIVTLNMNGASFCYATELTEAFFDYCKTPDCTYVLEVGAAFGIKTSQIVQTNTFVVANDIEPRHLEIMKDTFMQLAVKAPCFHNVNYVVGNIIDLGEQELGSRKFDAILCESVLHFMRPEAMRKTLSHFYTHLKEGGRLFLTVCTPFIQGFCRIYENNKLIDAEWPGFAEDPEALDSTLLYVHKPFHSMDQETLIRELALAGFSVVSSKYISKSYRHPELQYEGRDWLIAIAEKP